ncbi:MAG: PAS domain S-box protein [Betaproteobacteria bacterium]|nr:MAG: PAS domain S-box protein [Betaproteobacteria bacterium]
MPTAAARSAASRITLTRALVALGAVLVGINIASAIWDARTDRDRTELRARRNLSNLSGLLSEQTAAALEAVDLVLRDAVRDGTTAKVAAMMPRLRDEMIHIPQVAGFLVIDADGSVVGRTNETPTIDHGFAGRAFFTAHREARDAGLFFSEPYKGGGDGTRWRFVMSRRLNTPNGAFSGVIAAVMEIENFDRLYRMIDVGEGGFINLRARDGTIITRVPDPREARGRKFPNPDISTAVEREGRFTGWTTSPILNERVLVSTVAVRGFPLEVLVGATEAAVFAPWHSEASRIFLRTVLTSAAMLALIALAAWGLARRERALQRKQRQFRAMIEHSSDGVILTRPETGIFYASPGLERMLGYTIEDLREREPYELLHPDHVEATRSRRSQMMHSPGKVVTVETMVRHKDGSWRWIENTVSNLLEEPSVRALVMNFRDITERKLADAERSRLEQRLRQAQKMEAVGRLAGGIAHDFNNILGGILGYAEMLVEQTAAGSPFKRYAQNVLTAANRARGLVDQILAYSRSQRGKRVAVDLSRIVAETLELVRGSLDPGISLEAKLPAAPLQVFGDATQLHQVVMNLCTNAIQAMGGKGTLRVTLETAEVGAERSLAHGTVVPGTYARLAVEDTGTGMDEATLGRIFEPFFTTKEVGKGTGLGLALVYGIITDASGAIDVASAPGRGTAFTIYMPRVDVAVADDDEKQGPVARGNGERVLVVDDEQPLLAVTAEVLSRLGYEPIAFSESLAALAEFEAQPGRFDAAITDEVMPGLSGTELAGVIHRRRPELPILLVSGYIGPMMSERATAAGVNEVLKKPVQSREIAAALARVLATR